MCPLNNLIANSGHESHFSHAYNFYSAAGQVSTAISEKVSVPYYPFEKVSVPYYPLSLTILTISRSLGTLSSTSPEVVWSLRL